MLLRQLFSLRFVALIGMLVAAALLNDLHAQLFSRTTTGLDNYPIPAGVNAIEITAVGASGGGSGAAPAGTGGTVTATFAVSQGDVIRVIVGQAGLIQNNRGGGGGATGVILCPGGDCNTAPELLMVAGAGGGAGSNLAGQQGKGAVTTAGSGNGGSGAISAGGGGFLSAGGRGASAGIVGGGQANFNAISPGGRGSRGYGAGDGFGGGGNNELFQRAGGGGGGYTGGNGVSNDQGGNGGSNFVSPNAEPGFQNLPGVDGGTSVRIDGSVVINVGTIVGTDPEILSADLPDDPQLLLNLTDPKNVALTGTFKAGTGPHTITIDWGDTQTSTAVVDESAETFSANHDYQNTGIYTVKINITDNAGKTGDEFVAEEQVIIYHHRCGQALMKPTYTDPVSGKKVIIDAKVDFASQTTFTPSSKVTFFHKTSPQFYFESNSITTLVTSGGSATIIVEGGIGPKGTGPFPTTHKLTMTGIDPTPNVGGGNGTLDTLAIEEIATGNVVYELSAPLASVPRITVNNAVGCRLGQRLTEVMPFETTVFPNPFDQSFVVEFSEVPANQVELRVSNAMGQEVFAAKTEEIRNKINLDQVPAGVYYLQVRQGQVVHTTKLIKQ